jgi:hypothetical protein
VRKIENIFMALVGLGTVSVFALYLLPFSFFVDVEHTQYHDMCVGDTKQTVDARRDVLFSNGIKAEAFGQVFQFEGQKLSKTVIKRETQFVYNQADGEIVYEVQWDKPIVEPGRYAAADFVTIEPLLFRKTHYQEEEYQTFNVYACD